VIVLALTPEPHDEVAQLDAWSQLERWGISPMCGDGELVACVVHRSSSGLHHFELEVLLAQPIPGFPPYTRTWRQTGFPLLGRCACGERVREQHSECMECWKPEPREKKCPFFGCVRKIPTDHLMCVRHWPHVPAVVKGAFLVMVKRTLPAARNKRWREEMALLVERAVDMAAERLQEVAMQGPR
jgi:hypothetical protein